MIFRNLDENGDWRIGKGKNDYVARVEAIGLNIKTRIYSWVGDCFFAQREGIDWYNRLGSKDQRDLLEADLKLIILKSDGVTGLLSFDTILNERDFTASYSINTIYSKAYSDSIKVGI